LQRPALEGDLKELARGFPGRVGACAMDASGPPVCVRGDERFSMQSVMKLLVAIAVMDAVEHRGWHLDDPVTVRREDTSVFVQPIAKLAAASPNGYATTIGDLMRRAVVDSDSMATDVLLAKLGGPPNVQALLERKGIRGMRIDRDERTLQTETNGLEWRQEFIDPDAMERARAALSPAERTAAWRYYQKDERDTSTPAAMARLLYMLGSGRLLNPTSTSTLLKVMEQTATFPNRLKAGLSPGWALGHKTGSSGTWEGVTIATNDVGVITAPDGKSRIGVVVFIGDSRASLDDCAAVMAKISKAVIARYR